MSIWDWIFNRRKVQGTEIEGAPPQPRPPGDDWRQWCVVSEEDLMILYSADAVEAWYPTWPEPQIIHPRSLHPAANVYNLWWRPLP